MDTKNEFKTRARADDGREFTIHVSPPPEVPAGHLGDPAATVRGRLGELVTSDGETVSAVDDDTFDVETPGGTVRVHRIR